MVPFSLPVQFPERAITARALTENADIEPSQLRQHTNAPISVPLTQCRSWDNLHLLLPNAAAADDLGLVTGTAGTHFPKITAGDVKAASVTRRLGVLLQVPHNFEESQTLTLRVRAAVETSVADASCTVDVSVYSSDGDGTSSADLVNTVAQDMNSLIAANFDFNILTGSLSKGQELYAVVTIASVDAATVTAVTPAIYGITLLADLRG